MQERFYLKIFKNLRPKTLNSMITIKLLKYKKDSYNTVSLRYNWCFQHAYQNSTKALDVVRSFLFPFYSFYINVNCLIWIVEDSIQSRNKNKWASLWSLDHRHVRSFAGLSAPHVSVCCCNQGPNPFQWYWQND